MPLILSIPTWATFAKIPDGTPPAGLVALNAALGTTLVVGDVNPVWADLQDIALGGGWFLRADALHSMADSSPIENTAFLALAQVQLAVAVGGEVTGMQVFFELTAEQLVEQVPASFPNRTYVDASEESQIHTWETWGRDGDSHAPEEHGGKWYKSSADANNLGQPIPASCWVFAGLTVKTVAEFIAIRTEHETPPE